MGIKADMAHKAAVWLAPRIMTDVTGWMKKKKTEHDETEKERLK